MYVSWKFTAKFKANKWEKNAGSLPPPWLIRPHQRLLHPGESCRLWIWITFINRSFARRLSWVYSPKTLSLGVGTSPTAATSSACSTWSRGILGALHQPRSETSVLRNYPWSSWWPNSREIWRSFRLHHILAVDVPFFGALKNPTLQKMTFAQFSNFRSSMEMLSWMSSCQPSSLQVSFYCTPSSLVSLVCWLINTLKGKRIRASCLLRRLRSRRELREIGWKMSRRKPSR